ncbi:glycine-rich domain-containing protein-like [Pseudoalteromonas xiamenensis]
MQDNIHLEKIGSVQSDPAKNEIDLSFLVSKIMESIGVSRKKAEESLAQYIKWLTLKKENPTLRLIPTLDIDMVWHIHLSNTSKYRSFCESFFGFTLSHTPRTSKDFDFDKTFNETRCLWLKTFGEELVGSPSLCD